MSRLLTDGDPLGPGDAQMPSGGPLGDEGQATMTLSTLLGAGLQPSIVFLPRRIGIVAL